jgi:YD repeat-containing protein
LPDIPAVAINGAQLVAAGYDCLSRLTSVTGPDGNRTYAYDPVGNPASKVP